MTDNLTTVAGADATLPASSPLATKQLADGSHAGLTVVVSPADRTRALLPAADGSLAVTGPLTDTQLRAVALPVSGSVSTGLNPLTDAQLRATAVPVSGPLTDTQLRATALPVSGPLTDTQLRASAVPVSMATQTPDVTDRIARLLGVASAPAATLVVTAVSSANAAVTATLPAVASAFHYISRIIIERIATTAVAGTAVLTYTSTNLPGSWARSAGNAAPVGATQKDVDEVLMNELKSSVVNTATTIVAPAGGATVITRITVYYRAAA